MELNQIVLYLERLPDENQTDHIDWGFRISVLYGLDYRFTTTRGLFSDQLLKAQQLLRLRHADDLSRSLHSVRFSRHEHPHWSHHFRAGHRSATGAEQSHGQPLAFSTASITYCQEGIFTTTKINNQWTIQAGISDGTDVAIWQEDPGPASHRHGDDSMDFA